MSEIDTMNTNTDTTNVTPSTLAVVARMKELNISRAILTEMTGHREAINKMALGMKITTTVANRICQSLDCVYDDLFTTVTGGNHFGYALPRAENDVDDDESDSEANGMDKSTVKQHLIVDLKPTPPVQSACSQCGRMSISFEERDGMLMCRRCAGIPRCADCHNPAHLLYVVDGRMICPRCDSRMKQRQFEQRHMEATK